MSKVINLSTIATRLLDARKQRSSRKSMLHVQNAGQSCLRMTDASATTSLFRGTEKKRAQTHVGHVTFKNAATNKGTTIENAQTCEYGRTATPGDGDIL